MKQLESSVSMLLFFFSLIVADEHLLPWGPSNIKAKPTLDQSIIWESKDSLLLHMAGLLLVLRITLCIIEALSAHFRWACVIMGTRKYYREDIYSYSVHSVHVWPLCELYVLPQLQSMILRPTIITKKTWLRKCIRRDTDIVSSTDAKVHFIRWRSNDI